MRVLVLGGYGNFGARICRALAGNPAMEVVAAGRHPRDGGARLDLAAPGFAADLAALSPGIVVHCVGPFQGQDYRVAEAALAAGAHYLDLADGRAFVAGIAQALDARARAAGKLAVSGASTLPALSSAVIDSFAGRFAAIEEIQISIAPGQRAPRGAATIAAVFSYAGRPFKWLADGTWTNAWGWQELRRFKFAGAGTRLAAACDVPDLELLPARYPGARTVQFRAALELGIQHVAIWLAAGWRRCGLPLPLERWAGGLEAMARLLDPFGSDCGGMLVQVTGRRADGGRSRMEWHLTARASHGPEIPCMAAILLARGLASGKVAARGALPCMGLVTLPEFESEFARWRITTRIEERAA